MEGTTISHYEVIERLGAGGMGVVYRALDTRLNRSVAIKVLAPELSSDEEARRRFMHEARAASALDHPNICTIYEIDSTPEGQMFIVMALYEGETVRQLADRAPLPVDEALDVVGQVARGLGKAHSAGIVHRDIKPANLIRTEDGLVKIVDFGVAKLRDVTDLTQTGATIGTVSYMSPEVLKGKSAGPAADIWALGVVLFELLTGRKPFDGDNAWAVIAGIAERDPGPPSALRPDTPDQLDRIVSRALQKDASRRFATGSEFERATHEVVTGSSPKSGPRPGSLRRGTIAAAVLALVAFAGMFAWFSARSAEAQRAREEALPAAEARLAENDFVAAYRIAREVEEVIPNDPVLANVLSAASRSGTVVSSPPGASVWWRPYGTGDDQWRALGRTPVEEVSVPSGLLEWQLELEGYATRHVALNTARLLNAPEPLILVDTAAAPRGMVLVDDDNRRIALSGWDVLAPVEPFFLDRYETTNREFQDFVDVAAYEDSTLWQGLEFARDGERIPWSEAMEEFVDATGYPGPGTWEIGRYPEGQGDFPVQGVSWYEAVAYAHFRGKTLPTAYHWARAALTGRPARFTVPASNLEGSGPMPVAEGGALDPYGTSHMTGNVREWTWNEFEGGRMALGGAWSDPIYLFNSPVGVDPWDRMPFNGIRLMQLLDGDDPPPELTGAVSRGPSSDRRGAVPVAREVFEVLAGQYEYPRIDADVDVEPAEITGDVWTRQVVTMNLSYTDDRLRVALFLPSRSDPPYQTIVYAPNTGDFQRDATPLPERPPRRVEHILRSGRALVVTEYEGSFERADGVLFLPADEQRRALRDHILHWREDLGRAIDMLEGRADIDSERIGFFGSSFGASTFLPPASLERRMKVWVLGNGGFTYRDLPPEANAVNFVPYVTVPVLMLNGDLDELIPRETLQMPLLELLGSATKERRALPAGHGALDRSWVIGESLRWYDSYLGPVE